MKIRLIIEGHSLECDSWEYRLHTIMKEPGKYYVRLRGLDGARLSHTPEAGPYHSLDTIVEQAQTIYLQLVAKREAPAAVPVPVTPLPADVLSGNPAIDRRLE